MKRYDEIHIPNDRKSLPEFPKKCPVCGADTETEVKSEKYYECSITYKCGGTYTHKEQLQNHTNKYWGECGAE